MGRKRVGGVERKGSPRESALRIVSTLSSLCVLYINAGEMGFRGGGGELGRLYWAAFAPPTDSVSPITHQKP